jgi:hypothetical protein
LEATRLRGRPRNRWQDEVREDGRIVGGEEWQGRIYNREEWKKLQRTARNCCILRMALEWNRIGAVSVNSSNAALPKDSMLPTRLLLKHPF